jgi:sterol desaturase/sphingolipid hydroxylase (fatty acid hydroxylase superfamily)
MGHKPMNSTQQPKTSVNKYVDELISSEFHYYFGFFANTVLVIFFMVQPMHYALGQWSMALDTTLGLFVAGYFAWTLLEYVMHRWLYHEIQSLFAKGHQMHHEEPLSLLGIPWLLNTLIILLVFWAGAALSAVDTAGLFLGGFWLGYLNYTIIHYGLHHWKLENHVWRQLWKHHKIHHKLPDKNIGVSVTFWDYVFRTKA